jgi:hypothetical protein
MNDEHDEEASARVQAKAKLAAFRKQLGPGALTDEEARELQLLRIAAGERVPSVLSLIERLAKRDDTDG